VLADVCAHLLATTVTVYDQAAVVLPARRVIVPGAPEISAWDCESVLVGFMQGRAGGSDTTARPGGVPAPVAGNIQVLRWDLRLILVRCIPTVTKEGAPPPAEDVTGAGRMLLDDAELVAKALYRAAADPAVRELANGTTITHGGIRALGPSGGYAGVMGALTIA
jgi:hypothetical protein